MGDNDMSNCGQCGGGGAGGVCTCFTGDSFTSDARGNGSFSNPFNFPPMGADPSQIVPNPRPCGHIARITTVQAVLANTSTPVIFNTDFHPFTGGMTNLVGAPTRLTAPVSGTYLVGGFVVLSNAAAASTASLRILKNGTTTQVWKDYQDPSGGVQIMLDVMTLMTLFAGDYIELMVNTTIAVNVNITHTDFGPTYSAPAYLWAQGMNF